MEPEQLKQTLKSLHQELESQDAVDPELMALLATLDNDIHLLIDQMPDSAETDSTVDAAEFLAARFAVNHPRAEAIMQEIVALLGRMGV